MIYDILAELECRNAEATVLVGIKKNFGEFWV